MYLLKNIPVNKLRVFHTTKRLRLGAKSEGKDHWFWFEKQGLFKRRPDMKKIAEEVVKLAKTQGESWWKLQKDRI